MGVVWEIAAAREKLFTFESGAEEERRVLAVSFSHFAPFSLSRKRRGGGGRGVCATRPFDALTTLVCQRRRRRIAQHNRRRRQHNAHNAYDILIFLGLVTLEVYQF